MYEIKWEGFPSNENTFKDVGDIKAQVPDVVRQFEAQS